MDVEFTTHNQKRGKGREIFRCRRHIAASHNSHHHLHLTRCTSLNFTLGPALPLHAKFTMWVTVVLMYAERSGALRCSYSRSCLIVVPSRKHEGLGTRELRLCLIVSNSNSEKSINTDRLLAIPCRKQIMNQLILETRNSLSYSR